MEFLHRLRDAAGPAKGAVRLGIGDDCAVVRPPRGQDLLVTTDFSLEGRHFRRDWHTGTSAGHRCLARGLSDIAAMGGRPLSAFLSLALPTGLRSSTGGRRWVEDFLRGLLALAEATGTQLSGGDTAAAPGEGVLADIALLGSAPRDRALRRDGARAGDLLYVTGSLGGAAAELRQLEAKPRQFRSAKADGTHPHLFPAPRLQVGEILLRRGLATAAMDVSDGLSTDVRHLCEESGLGAVIDAAAIPVHALALKAGDDGTGLQMALHGGEDYELLFTAAAGTSMPKKIAGVAIHRIGVMMLGGGVRLRNGNGECELAVAGWEHAI